MEQKERAKLGHSKIREELEKIKLDNIPQKEDWVSIEDFILKERAV